MREYSRKQLFFSSVAILGPGLLGGSLALAAVSYTHLTLPTIA